MSWFCLEGESSEPANLSCANFAGWFTEYYEPMCWVKKLDYIGHKRFSLDIGGEFSFSFFGACVRLCVCVLFVWVFLKMGLTKTSEQNRMILLLCWFSNRAANVI